MPHIGAFTAGRGREIMRAVKLSICMPAYNYGPYIETALMSVLGQREPDVEVVVLDSASTDETRAVVQGIAANHPYVRYVYQYERRGIDGDLARCVELAAGEYCWLLSADDALKKGAVRRIMEELDSGCGIFLCNRVWCDQNLKPVWAESWLRNGNTDRTVDFARGDDVSHYLADAQSLGALFSFMSCIGFRREVWLRAKTDASLVGTNYAHVQRLFSMGRDGARLRYISAPLVLCRGGTDSFRSAGLATRLLIDLRGFMRLSQVIYPDSEILQSAFRGVLKREHPWLRWVRARSETPDSGLWDDVERLLVVYGFSPIQLRVIDMLGAVLGFVRRPTGT